MFCEQCGKELEPGAKFCDACGTPTNNVDVTDTESEQVDSPQMQQPVDINQGKVQSQEKKKSHIGIIILIIVLVVVLATFGGCIACVSCVGGTSAMSDVQSTPAQNKVTNDVYDYVGLTETEFLGKSGFSQNDYGAYPNEDESVFTFIDGKLMGITLFEGQGTEYSFKGMSIGDAYKEGIDGFSKISDPLGRADGSIHHYRDEKYANYMLSIRCNDDGTIAMINYTYMDDEEWQAMSDEAGELNTQYGDVSEQNVNANPAVTSVSHEKTPGTYVCNHGDYILYANQEWTSEIDFHLTGWIEDSNGNVIPGTDVEDDLTCTNYESEDEWGQYEGDHSYVSNGYDGTYYYKFITYYDAPFDDYEFRGNFYQIGETQSSSTVNAQPQDIQLITDEDTFASFLRDQNNKGKTIQFYGYVSMVQNHSDYAEYGDYIYTYTVLFADYKEDGALCEVRSTDFVFLVNSMESLPVITNDFGLFTAKYLGQGGYSPEFYCEKAEFYGRSQ